MQAAQPGQILQTDLYDRIVLKENSLWERGRTSCQKALEVASVSALFVLWKKVSVDCCVMFTEEKNEFC